MMMEPLAKFFYVGKRKELETKARGDENNKHITIYFCKFGISPKLKDHINQR